MPDTFSILIVDDEPQVCALLTEVLSRAFQCSSVANASEAIALIEFATLSCGSGRPGAAGNVGNWPLPANR